MSVLLGLLVATVGQDPVGGINRLQFWMTDLAAGIAFVPAILGFLRFRKFLFRQKNVLLENTTHQSSMLTFQHFLSCGVIK